MAMENKKADTRHGILPLDVLFDVLVRLPAKEICRLRAVCRPWRSLTSDPLFIEAHAARHTGPLIVASFKGDGRHVHVMDLSGHVVKRVPVGDEGSALPSHLDLACVAEMNGSCSVINPATEAVLHLPDAPPDEDLWDPSSDEEWHWDISEWGSKPALSVFALGRVDSTGEYKVLRVSSMEYVYRDPDDAHGFSSVLTINGSGRTRWVLTKSPKFLVDMDYMDTGVVVGGSVHFIWSDQYPSGRQVEYIMSYGIEPDCIAAFDLETEQWATIPGPRLADHDDSETDDHEVLEHYIELLSGSTLAELNGYLVLVNNGRHYSGLLDLWFQTDTENHLWVKRYSIRAPESAIPDTERVKPLLLLDDGRIAIFLHHKGVLLLHDPTTDVFSEVDTRRLDAVALYTGSLLSLQSVAKV